MWQKMVDRPGLCLDTNGEQSLKPRESWIYNVLNQGTLYYLGKNLYKTVDAYHSLSR